MYVSLLTIYLADIKVIQININNQITNNKESEPKKKEKVNI